MGLDEQEETLRKHHPEVPSHFKCPISLCLMADPVSVCTGITYDRSSIEKWFQEGRRTCPVTMQELHSHELIPNHTLQRIIHGWCAANRFQSGARGDREQPMDLREAQVLVAQLRIPRSRPVAVKRLIARSQEERSKTLLIRAGLAPVLVSSFSEDQGQEQDEEDSQAQILSLLPPLIANLDEPSRKELLSPRNLAAIARLLQRGDLHTRVSAAALIEELCCADKEARGAVGATAGIFEGLVRLVGEDHSQRRHRPAIRGSLRAVLAVCPPLKNRVRLVETGVVAPLAELLVEADKVTTEAILAALECLCGCAEGRAAVARHALAVPAVARKLFKVSDMATEYAIDVLWAVCKYCPDEIVKRRMVEVGLFPKLFFFLQIGCNPRTKHKAGDLLKLLHRAYRECIDGSGSNNDGAGGDSGKNRNKEDNTCLLTAAA
ncbi:hypothetical protein SELMODRAFT_125560 [Selaginella moellendorffii]|uniref:RING-type E3 ubiquitin transferase n=2 Tax=Selaginella moellendorffii TaxID=88036 RepID=D8SV60_SELML|nr:hypothetical protein SELMODRAFT_125560 [Selaginella moellendorffii]